MLHRATHFFRSLKKRFTKKPAEKLGVYFWPDYSSTNPYQNLLYSEAHQYADISGGDIDAAIHVAKQGRSIVFHLHWLNPLLNRTRTEEENRRIFNDFMKKVSLFQRLGGKFLWTLHNKISHDSPFPALEKEAAQRIMEIADGVHIHAKSTLNYLKGFYTFPEEKILISRHGHYLTTYPNLISRRNARHQLGIVDDEAVFLFLGQIRPYKGLDKLIPAFAEIHKLHKNTRLLLVGNPYFDPLEELKSTMDRSVIDAISCHFEFVPDDHLQVYLNAADAMVLPFQEILISSSVALGFSFGIPIIAPNIGSIKEMLGETGANYLYDRQNALGLYQMMERRLVSIDPQEDAQRRIKLIQSAAKMTWPNFYEVFKKL